MEKTLAELKSKEVELRDKIERGQGTLQNVLDLNKNRRKVIDIEQRVLRTIMWVLIGAVILVSGCNIAREGVYGIGRIAGAAGQDIMWVGEKLGDNINTKPDK